MQLFQFISASLVGSLVVVAVSLVWPLVTASTMPPVLEAVRNTVVQTPVGSDASTILGVTDPSTVTPVNVPEFIANKSSELLGVAQNSIKQSVTTTVITQLVTRFQQLPDDQKEAVRISICAQPTPVVEATE